MNELPELAIVRIFGHLSIGEKLKVREVCKRWLVLADECLRSRRELVLFCLIAKCPLIWSHNNQPINLNNAVIVNFYYQSSRYFKRTFSGIRSLCVAYSIAASENLYERLTRFKNLEHFQFSDLLMYHIQRPLPFPIDFSLPNLKTLHLGHTDKLVRLNCPNLRELSIYEDFVMTEELNPFFRKLRFLKANSFAHSPGSELPSLEVLCFCKRIHIDIANFPKLREVHFFYHRCTRLREKIDFQGSFEMSFGFLNNLIWQGKILKRSDFETYFDGIAYRDDPELRNRLLPAEDPNIHEHYNAFLIEKFESEELLNSKIEGTMKSFYLGRQLIAVVQQMSEELVEKVARCICNLTLSPKLTSLNGSRYRRLFSYVRALNVSVLSQQLLDQLPEILPNIVRLNFNHFHYQQRSYAFLSRFKALGHLKIPIEMISQDDFFQFLLSKQTAFYIEFPRWTHTIPFLCVVTNFYCNRRDKVKRACSEKEIFDTKEQMFDYFVKLGLLRKQFYEGFFERNYFLSEPPSPEEYFYEN